MGDLLRLALWCAVCAPRSPQATAIWESFDKVLGRFSAPQIKKSEIQHRLDALIKPRIAPMIIDDANWPLVLRLWRLLQAFQYKDMIIGSADSVGYGYGVRLKVDGYDQYFFRRSPAQLPGIFLGLRPTTLKIKDFEHQPQVKMEIGGDGIIISGQLASKKFSGLDAEMNSWIVDLNARFAPNLKASSVHAFDYDINPTSNGWSLKAVTPEGAIRLATQCARGSLLGFVPDQDIYDKGTVIMTLLRPTDEAPVKLMSEMHSRNGSLAEWLWLPPLPIIIDLPQEARVALDEQLHSIFEKNGEPV